MRAISLVLAGALALAIAGCGDSSEPGAEAPQGRARSFQMGFSSLPRELNADAYAEAIRFAGDHGDLVLIQRVIPWADFLPGASISDETVTTTASERRAVDDRDLELFFAIDVTDGATGRDRLANLPVSLAGKRFDDADVRRAFVAYAEYVAVNYRPAYLALGVEMNLYYEKDRADFENFRTLYAAAYDAVKRKSPDTQVTVTLQYEDLQGLLPREDRHFASWQLVRTLEPQLDFVGISTYPSFAYNSAAEIPASYYSALRAFTDKPIAIAEMGFSSMPGQQGLNSGSEPEQEAFLRRVLDDAQRIGMPFVVWFAIWDPAYARDTSFGAFRSIGLRRSDDGEKPAWAAWDAAERRPYRRG